MDWRRINAIGRQKALDILSPVFLLFIASLFMWLAATWLQTAWKLRNFDELDSGIRSKLLDSFWKCQYLLQHFLAVLVIIFHFLLKIKIEKLMGLIFKLDEHMKKLKWSFKAQNWPFFWGSFIFLWSFYVMCLYSLLTMYFHNTIYQRRQVDVNIIFRTLNFVVIILFYPQFLCNLLSVHVASETDWLLHIIQNIRWV